MSTAPDPRHELSSAYFVHDRANQDEMARLQIQSQMFTRNMGGVLAEQPDPNNFRRILDIGCGTGDWLIETAKTYPDISLLVGVDISNQMIEYAQAQARTQQVDDRVEFHVMDVLRMIEFPNDFFDLINERCAESFVRTWEWPKLLSEYQRVTRPGGIIRLTEPDAHIQYNSPALSHLDDLFLQAFSQSGHTFLSDQCGNIDELAPLLTQSGLQNVQTREYTLVFRAGTKEGQHFYEDVSRFYRTIVPFLRRWIRLPDDYEAIYQQALKEMQQPDFVASWRLLTAWGSVSSK